MMKTIIVVSQVSFQLGQVTFLHLAAHFAGRTAIGRDAARAAAALPRLPSVVRLFRHVGHFNLFFVSTWQEWRDSNPRPSVLETDALPAELHS